MRNPLKYSFKLSEFLPTLELLLLLSSSPHLPLPLLSPPFFSPPPFFHPSSILLLPSFPPPLTARLQDVHWWTSPQHRGRNTEGLFHQVGKHHRCCRHDRRCNQTLKGIWICHIQQLPGRGRLSGSQAPRHRRKGCKEVP